MTDIQQTPGDRLRFEILLKSLMEGNLNLAVLSEYDMVLDYYGNLFEQSLRDKGETQVEFCFSTNSEQLVQKFNEILSDLTLNQALERQPKHVSRRYLLFRDSILMQDFELQLLARLVNGFPAGNISVILLINTSANARNKLAAFGKNLLQWEVETKAGQPRPSYEEWQDTAPPGEIPHEPVLHQRAEITPESGETKSRWLDPSDPTPVQDTDVSKLLNMPTKTAWRVPSFGFTKGSVDRLRQSSSDEPSAAVPPLLDVTPPMVKQAMAKNAPEVPSAPVQSPTKSVFLPDPPTPMPPVSAAPETSSVVMFDPPAKKFPWGMVLMLFMASASASAYLYKDTLLTQIESIKKDWLRGTPAQEAPAEVTVSQIHDQASAAMAAAQAKLDAASAMAAVAASEANQAAASATAAVVPASTASASITSSVPAASAVSPASVAAARSSASATPVHSESTVKSVQTDVAETSPDKAKAQTKVNASAADETWLDQMPANGWVLQLAAFDSKDEALEFKNAQRAYSDARILAPYKKGSHKRYFILVEGPFATKAQADKFIAKNPLYAKGWLRSSKSVKAQFERT